MYHKPKPKHFLIGNHFFLNKYIICFYYTCSLIISIHGVKIDPFRLPWKLHVSMIHTFFKNGHQNFILRYGIIRPSISIANLRSMQ